MGAWSAVAQTTRTRADPMYPLPVPTLETRPFWAGARSGVLRLPRCACNGRLLYPPPPRCPDCLSPELDWVTLSGEARLWAWTEIRIEVFRGEPGPTIVGQVSIDEQPNLVLTALVEDPGIAAMPLGAPVRLGFRILDDERALPVIEARGPRAGASDARAAQERDDA